MECSDEVTRVPSIPFSTPPSSLSASPASSWWNRIGQQIDAAALKVGGAPIHHTHWLGNFGNTEHRLVFCSRCGGTTTGAYSPLLAGVCRQQAAGTLSRHVNRMLLHSLWPTQAMGRQWGRAACSPIIRFQPTHSSSHFIIVGSGSGGYHSEAGSTTLVSPELSTRSTGPNPGTSSDTLGPHPWTDRA